MAAPPCPLLGDGVTDDTLLHIASFLAAATESWLCLMHEVGVLRVPLAFGRAHGGITLSENGALATMGVGGGGE